MIDADEVKLNDKIDFITVESVKVDGKIMQYNTFMLYTADDYDL